MVHFEECGDVVRRYGPDIRSKSMPGNFSAVSIINSKESQGRYVRPTSRFTVLGIPQTCDGTVSKLPDHGYDRKTHE